MAVVVREIKRGARHSIWAFGNNDTCILLDFLKRLKADDSRVFDKANALLDRAVNFGPPKNKEKCRLLAKTEGIWEFKTGDGVRIFWFWDRNYMMVCSHGFMKKSRTTPKNEIIRAMNVKKDYETARMNNSLISIPIKKDN